MWCTQSCTPTPTSTVGRRSQPQFPGFDPLEWVETEGAAAVVAWSDAIHGKTGARAEWGHHVARALQAEELHGHVIEIPPLPGARLNTALSRYEAAQRVYKRGEYP